MKYDKKLDELFSKAISLHEAVGESRQRLDDFLLGVVDGAYKEYFKIAPLTVVIIPKYGFASHEVKQEKELVLLGRLQAEVVYPFSFRKKESQKVQFSVPALPLTKAGKVHSGRRVITVREEAFCECELVEGAKFDPSDLTDWQYKSLMGTPRKERE